jgi:hypothetical protein
MPEEVQEEIIARAHSMNVRDWRILGARISRDHHIASPLRLHQLPRNVALHDFMRKVTPHRLATSSVNLKTLLQREPASLKTNVHEAGAGEVCVGENYFHPRSLRILPRHREARNVKNVACLPETPRPLGRARVT